MKKFAAGLFSVALFAGIAFDAVSQCTPNSSVNAQGFHADDGTFKLPDGTMNVAYSNTITAVVPVQIIISSFPVTVDSIKVTGIPNLPAGLTYQTDKANWPGGSKGCILVSGTPSAQTSGPVTLQIKYTAFAPAPVPPSGIPLSYDSVTINILPTGVPQLNPSRFEIAQNSPNPFYGFTDIAFATPVSDKVVFKVYNMLGKIVYVKDIDADAGINHISFNAKDFAPGVYMYSLSNGDSNLIRRMVIAKK